MIQKNITVLLFAFLFFLFVLFYLIKTKFFYFVDNYIFKKMHDINQLSFSLKKEEEEFSNLDFEKKIIEDLNFNIEEKALRIFNKKKELLEKKNNLILKSVKKNNEKKKLFHQKQECLKMIDQIFEKIENNLNQQENIVDELL